MVPLGASAPLKEENEAKAPTSIAVIAIQKEIDDVKGLLDGASMEMRVAQEMMRTAQRALSEKERQWSFLHQKWQKLRQARDLLDPNGSKTLGSSPLTFGAETLSKRPHLSYVQRMERVVFTDDTKARIHVTKTLTAWGVLKSDGSPLNPFEICALCGAHISIRSWRWKSNAKGEQVRLCSDHFNTDVDIFGVKPRPWEPQHNKDETFIRKVISIARHEQKRYVGAKQKRKQEAEKQQQKREAQEADDPVEHEDEKVIESDSEQHGKKKVTETDAKKHKKKKRKHKTLSDSADDAKPKKKKTKQQQPAKGAAKGDDTETESDKGEGQDSSSSDRDD